MVLESIIPVKNAERRPIEMLPLAFLYSTIAIFIGLWIFPNHASLTVVFFTVMALLPLMVNMIRFEEETIFSKRLQQFEPKHQRTIPFFVFMFVGMVIAFSAWFVLFPQEVITRLFSLQINTIQAINSQVNIAGNVVSMSSYFTAVLINNLKVLLFSLFFSFIYGAGAIFILTWNASVVAVAIGNVARKVISSYAGAVGITGAAVYFKGFSLGLLRYMIHGIPEIAAYFVGGLAGGLISVAIIKYEFMDDKFRRVLADAGNLVLLAIGFLLIAVVLETFVSPLIPI